MFPGRRHSCPGSSWDRDSEDKWSESESAEESQHPPSTSDSTSVDSDECEVRSDSSGDDVPHLDFDGEFAEDFAAEPHIYFAEDGKLYDDELRDRRECKAEEGEDEGWNAHWRPLAERVEKEAKIKFGQNPRVRHL